MMSAVSPPSHVPQHLIFDVGFSRSDEDCERMIQEPFAVWAGLRDKPPVFWVTEDLRAPQGCWVVTTADYVREILQDGRLFSSARMLTGTFPRTLRPIFLDPPEHMKYRSLLSSLFAPKAVDLLEGAIARLSDELIHSFEATGECDFIEAFARPFPTVVFCELMGLPLEDRPKFLEWEHAIFQGRTAEVRVGAGDEVVTYLKGLIERKRETAGEDIVSHLLTAQVDGAPITADALLDMCFMLFVAGLDTVTAALGHSMLFLARNPELQAKLRSQPDLLTDAVEEMLRWHSWINTQRTATADIDFHGVQMKEGDAVLCMLHHASRDPAEFPHPDDFIVDREPNRHFAFGGGPHRCAGSHLARRELRVALRMILDRLGDFCVKPGAVLRYDGGLSALGALPLVWSRAA